MLRDNIEIKEIAKLFNVKKSTINNIKLGKTWKHIKIEGFQEGSSRLTIEQVIEIKKMIKEDMKTKDIVKITGHHRGRINSIKTGKSWSHVKI